MTKLQTLINAGFAVEQIGPFLVVSLTNRKVYTIEVAMVLNVEPSSLSYSNGSVIVVA
jgi:hypothetical protein